MLPDGARIICMISHMFPALDGYYTDTAQHLTTAGCDPDDLLIVMYITICPRCGTFVTVAPNSTSFAWAC